MGCVSYASKCFKGGEISAKNYRKAYQRARVEVSHIRPQFRSARWEECVGSSGTLRAIDSILQLNNWSDGAINREGLSKLEKKLLKFERMEDIRLEGLAPARRGVILPGVAITSALFDELGVESMRTSPGALREGVIYDLLGRLSHEDVRERSINALAQRYAVDESTADIVERRCRVLFDATREVWGLERADWELLHWAARSHEIGMAISHKHFNRHSAYLLRNSDLPGFSQGEQEQLAVLVQGHRGKLKQDLFTEAFEADPVKMRYLLAIIRLAARLKYAEQLESLPEFTIAVKARRITLDFPGGWLKDHPLTASELEMEQDLFGALQLELRLR
jgi:exopolyphosphatase/guanosine-5'-triphosphate,3'-diphosphate pyrophosphatase